MTHDVPSRWPQSAGKKEPLVERLARPASHVEADLSGDGRRTAFSAPVSDRDVGVGMPSDVEQLANKEAGDRARAEALMLDRLVETLRLASFRSYLDATVRTMSSIVPDVLAMVGSDAGSALYRVRPSGLWPSNTAPRRAAQRYHSGALNMVQRRTTARALQSGSKPVTPPQPHFGDAIVADDALGAWVEVKVAGDCLDVVLQDQGYRLSTAAGTAHLKLATSLPATVLHACVRRPVDQVVAHPLLSGRGYVVEGAGQVGAASTLSFQVGLSALLVPWRTR